MPTNARRRFTYPEGWAIGLDGGWQQKSVSAETSVIDVPPGIPGAGFVLPQELEGVMT